MKTCQKPAPSFSVKFVTMVRARRVAMTNIYSLQNIKNQCLAMISCQKPARNLHAKIV